MNDFAAELMKDVLDAYSQRDVERALEVWDQDAISIRSKTRCSAIC